MLKTILIENEGDLQTAFRIRQVVFVEEQKVSREEEYDAFEDISRHFLVVELPSELPCGTARWRFTDKGIKLERFAVLKEFRSKGVGSALVKAVLEDIASRNDTKGNLIYLHAQVSAVGLYQKFDFKPMGDYFWEAGIQHIKMAKVN